MTDDQHDIVPILVKYALHERLTEPEERFLALWRQRSEKHAVLTEQFRNPHWLAAQGKLLHRPPTEAMWDDIKQYIDAVRGVAP